MHCIAQEEKEKVAVRQLDKNNSSWAPERPRYFFQTFRVNMRIVYRMPSRSTMPQVAALQAVGAPQNPRNNPFSSLRLFGLPSDVCDVNMSNL